MSRYFPDLNEFQAAAKNADLIPVYRQLLSDHLTPVTAFELVGHGEHALLLESVVGNEKIGRYSFIASSPSVVYRVKDGWASIQQYPRPGIQAGAAIREFTTTDPLADLARLKAGQRYHRNKNLPPFTGGLIGYAGYDTIRYYEGEKLPAPPRRRPRPARSALWPLRHPHHLRSGR
ncbi:MAG TPA: hypothetical protein VHP11_02705 [Tepidisphaeraceae bacterium]|nr:hypothetical protein [Tepidisphaeraceae bacterium]